MTGLKRDWLAPKRFAELNRWAGFYHSSVSFINLHARGGPTIGQTNHNRNIAGVILTPSSQTAPYQPSKNGIRNKKQMQCTITATVLLLLSA